MTKPTKRHVPIRLGQVQVLTTRITEEGRVLATMHQLSLYRTSSGSAAYIDAKMAYDKGGWKDTDIAFRTEFYHDGKWYEQSSTGKPFMQSGYDIDFPEDLLVRE